VIQAQKEKKRMSELPSTENNEASSSSSWWLESLFGKTNPQPVTRNRSNCVSNTTLPAVDTWSRLKQFFNLSGLITRDTSQSSLSGLGYVNQVISK
jgi:hypothetical protein